MQLGSHLRASLWFLLRASSNPRQSFFGIGFDFIYRFAWNARLWMPYRNDGTIGMPKREAAFSNCTTPVGRLLAVAVGVDLAVRANSPLLSRSLEAQELDFAFAFSSQLRASQLLIRRFFLRTGVHWPRWRNSAHPSQDHPDATYS